MKFLDLTWQFDQIPGLAEKLVAQARSGAYILDENVKKFEAAWARYLGIGRSIALNSGADALFLAFKALGIGKGDKVAVQTNTFAATVYAIVHNGAVPVFVDVDPRYGCISLEHLKQVITREKPKAVVPVHLYGQPCFASEITALARENRMYVVEDCAQVHGGTWGGKKAGTFGDVSCFSFFPSKNLGAMGDAGAVCSDKPEIMEKIDQYHNVGQKTKNVHAAEYGGNSRMDALQALALLAKLDYLEAWNRERQRVAAIYRQELANAPVLMYDVHPQAQHVYHQFVIMADQRDQVMAALQAQGITTLIHYPTPCHQLPAFKQYAAGPLPAAETIARYHLSLPMSPHLTDDEARLVCAKIKEAVHGQQKPALVSR
jgi:dTDP-4-amino-4,6-dideoxygalactose transaminase